MKRILTLIAAVLFMTAAGHDAAQAGGGTHLRVELSGAEARALARLGAGTE